MATGNAPPTAAVPADPPPRSTPRAAGPARSPSAVAIAHPTAPGQVALATQKPSLPKQSFPLAVKERGMLAAALLKLAAVATRRLGVGTQADGDQATPKEAARALDGVVVGHEPDAAVASKLAKPVACGLDAADAVAELHIPDGEDRFKYPFSLSFQVWDAEVALLDHDVAARVIEDRKLRLLIQSLVTSLAKVILLLEKPGKRRKDFDNSVDKLRLRVGKASLAVETEEKKRDARALKVHQREQKVRLKAKAQEEKAKALEEKERRKAEIQADKEQKKAQLLVEKDTKMRMKAKNAAANKKQVGTQAVHKQANKQANFMTSFVKGATTAATKRVSSTPTVEFVDITSTPGVDIDVAVSLNTTSYSHWRESQEAIAKMLNKASDFRKSLSSGKAEHASTFLRAEVGSRRVLYSFHENHRPHFFGSSTKKSSRVTGRRPFAKDYGMNYDFDSDDEWEEEEPGESLVDSDEDKSDAGSDGPLEDDDDFLDENDTGSEEDEPPKDRQRRLKRLSGAPEPIIISAFGPLRGELVSVCELERYRIIRNSLVDASLCIESPPELAKNASETPTHITQSDSKLENSQSIASRTGAHGPDALDDSPVSSEKPLQVTPVDRTPPSKRNVDGSVKKGDRDDLTATPHNTDRKENCSPGQKTKPKIFSPLSVDQKANFKKNRLENITVAIELDDEETSALSGEDGHSGVQSKSDRSDEPTVHQESKSSETKSGLDELRKRPTNAPDFHAVSKKRKHTNSENSKQRYCAVDTMFQAKNEKENQEPDLSTGSQKLPFYVDNLKGALLSGSLGAISACTWQQLLPVTDASFVLYLNEQMLTLLIQNAVGNGNSTFRKRIARVTGNALSRLHAIDKQEPYSAVLRSVTSTCNNVDLRAEFVRNLHVDEPADPGLLAYLLRLAIPLVIFGNSRGPTEIKRPKNTSDAEFAECAMVLFSKSNDDRARGFAAALVEAVVESSAELSRRDLQSISNWAVNAIGSASLHQACTKYLRQVQKLVGHRIS